MLLLLVLVFMPLLCRYRDWSMSRSTSKSEKTESLRSMSTFPNPAITLGNVLSLLSKSLIKILDQIVDILEADRHSQETFR